MEYDFSVPKDYQNPQWEVSFRVHNWRNYISPMLQYIWQSFTDEQKAIIANNADEIAMAEYWD